MQSRDPWGAGFGLGDRQHMEMSQKSAHTRRKLSWKWNLFGMYKSRRDLL